MTTQNASRDLIALIHFEEQFAETLTRYRTRFDAQIDEDRTDMFATSLRHADEWGFDMLESLRTAIRRERGRPVRRKACPSCGNAMMQTSDQWMTCTEATCGGCRLHPVRQE